MTNQYIPIEPAAYISTLLLPTLAVAVSVTIGAGMLSIVVTEIRQSLLLSSRRSEMLALAMDPSAPTSRPQPAPVDQLEQEGWLERLHVIVGAAEEDGEEVILRRLEELREELLARENE
ncbi:hypothetical protein QBC39DRAFT_432782 [Podospora conica]|nr:hypothetical protein QBC39DRAFT_432782 [Schizothecium conicum]